MGFISLGALLLRTRLLWAGFLGDEYVTDTKGGAGLRVIDCGRSLASNPFLLLGLGFTRFPFDRQVDEIALGFVLQLASESLLR